MRSKIHFSITSILTMALLTGAAPLFAGATPAAGSLDRTFDTDGKVTTSFTTSPGSDEAYASATQVIQSQEMIVVGGNHFLTRYTANGSLDSTFGSGGITGTPFPIRALVAQADGKIVAAGLTADTSDLAVARFNSNGTLDASFGNGGVVTVVISTGSDGALAVAIQADGKIVAAGYAGGIDGFLNFALARLNANGTLDGGTQGFGTNGVVTTSISPYHDRIESIAINNVDGSIVVAGGSGGFYGAPIDFALARYTSSGVLVGGFGNGGIVVTDFGGFEGVKGVALQTINGELKIVAGGSTQLTGGTDNFALARYSYLNGGLDSSFGTGGKVITDFFGSTDLAEGLAIQSDNKIVLAGGARDDKLGKTFTAVARYTSTGALDLTFDRDGKVTTDFGYAGSIAMGVLLQAGNKIVAVGYTYIYRVANIFALARYNP